MKTKELTITILPMNQILLLFHAGCFVYVTKIGIQVERQTKNKEKDNITNHILILPLACSSAQLQSSLLEPPAESWLH